MPSIQDLFAAYKQAKDQSNQDQILAQPSIMDKATDENGNDIDPAGTAAIAKAKMRQDAINTGTGTAMGSIQPVQGALENLAGRAAIDETIPWAQRIKNAAQNSGVKVVPTAEQDLEQQIANQYKDSPKNFFDNARLKASENGVGSSLMEQQQMAAQKQTTQNLIDQRNADQLAAAKQKWSKLVGGQ